MDAHTEQLALADWATRTLLGDPPPWPLGESPSDVKAAEKFFDAQSVGPLCHHALQTLGAKEFLPEAIWELLRRRRQLAAALELVREHQETRVMQLFSDIGLQPLVLKGAAYARFLYPEKHLRLRCDMDLLFPDQKSAEMAWKCLGQEGYELLQNVVEGAYVSRQKTCVKPIAGGHALDIHWAVSNTHTFVRALPFDELERNALPLQSLHTAARTLGPIHSMLFACVHLFGHKHSGPIPGLLWLYDILLLSRRFSATDWQNFCREATHKGIAGICRHVLDRVNATFPMPGLMLIRPDLVAAEVREVFRPDRLRTPFGYRFHDLKALDSWSARKQWIRETLFPSAAYMRSKYATTRNAWLPLLYVHRAAAGLARRLKSSTKGNSG